MKTMLFSLLVLFSWQSNAVNYSFIRELNERALKLFPAQNGCFYSISTQLNCPDDYVNVRYFNPLGDVQSTLFYRSLPSMSIP